MIYARVEISLYGPRSYAVSLPDNWHSLSEEEQRAVYQPTLDRLLDDSLSHTVWIPEEDEE